MAYIVMAYTVMTSIVMAPVAVPIRPDTTTGVRSPLPVPVNTAQLREVPDDQDNVAHGEVPRLTLTVTSVSAKLMPNNVMLAPDVGGAFGLARFVKVGASYVKERRDVPIEPVISAKSFASFPPPIGDDSHTKLVSLSHRPYRPFLAHTLLSALCPIWSDFSPSYKASVAVAGPKLLPVSVRGAPPPVGMLGV